MQYVRCWSVCILGTCVESCGVLDREGISVNIFWRVHLVHSFICQGLFDVSAVHESTRCWILPPIQRNPKQLSNLLLVRAAASSIDQALARPACFSGKEAHLKLLAAPNTTYFLLMQGAGDPACKPGCAC